MRRLIMPLLALVLVVMLAASLSAATWYVKPDSSGDVATIDDARQAAASGDTILLANGTFTGDGNRDIHLDGKSVTVCSESANPDLCIIDCGGSASEFHAAFDIGFDGTPPVVIDGITIRGGYSSSAGAIYVGKEVDGSTAKLRNCVFTNNHSDWAGGVVMVLNDCTAIIDSCRFTSNSASQGSAIALCFSGSATVTGCTFSGNTAQYGGAVYVGYIGAAAATFTDCTFSGNTASIAGGGLFSDGSSLTLGGCTLSGNSASGPGGAVYFDGGTGSMTGCVSLRNTCTTLGSSTYCSTGSSVQITSCSFVADSSGGAVIYCSSGVSPSLDRTVIAFCKQAASIGCINPPGSPTLTCCDIYGNEYGDWTGCIAGQAGVNGNISQDPLFCDIPSGDLTNEACSPCLAANNSCDQDIGAQASDGCGCGEATEPATWGGIKAMYK